VSKRSKAALWITSSASSNSEVGIETMMAKADLKLKCLQAVKEVREGYVAAHTAVHRGIFIALPLC
jgi:hypothetical protein